MDGFLQTAYTYENSSSSGDFPRNETPVVILGKIYSTLYDYSKLQRDVLSLPWMTYRKDFTPIGGTGPKADQGWGCMLRCGQMMLCKALMNLHLSDEWCWTENSLGGDETYRKILEMFLDERQAPYSIHQITQMGRSEGKEIGQWFGPNTISHVLRKLSSYDDWNKLVVHVAMDNTVVVDDIKRLCRTRMTSSGVKLKFEKGLPDNTSPENSITEPDWRSVLLLVPLRLGLDSINEVYINNLKRFFHLKQTVGVLGGKPNHAHWFIGYTGDELVFLDPHTVQPRAKRDDWKLFNDSSYHCPTAGRMRISSLDPSLALGFLCTNESDLDDLCNQLIIDKNSSPLFEVVRSRPKHWPPQTSGNPHGTDTAFEVVSTEPVYDSDEYELV